MDYQELYKKYHKLMEENRQLKSENLSYRKQLGLDAQEEPVEADTAQTGSIVLEKNYSPQEKIALFMSLFHGRDDVYAKRWVNRKGEPGYSPVCLNDRVRGVCPKPKVKCKDCNNKNYQALSEGVIEKHLRGKDVYGVYPLLADETCYFLVMDFDGDNWAEDVAVVREICRKREIPVAVERSRSGNGAHAWFFFTERVSAVLARKFGSAILTDAMESRHQLRFRSYDRLFPNQDTLPKGGLGNLIALPLQLQARENNNSVFVDEKLEPYGDQWGFLSTVGKLSESAIESHVAGLCGGSELGRLRHIDEEESKPWQRRVGHLLSGGDFPQRVRVTKANMLYLEKGGFSQKALNTIQRLAAFKNPDFYKAQAMRLPTYEKPRIISLSDDSDGYLGLPRGCEAELAELLESYHVEIEWVDETFEGRAIDVEFCGELRGEQGDCASAMLAFDNGVLSATTAFGKTVIGAKLIAKRKVNTLVLVHTRQLLEQWQERLHSFLVINEELAEESKRGRKKKRSVIGQLGGGKNRLSGIVDIAVMQSLVRGNEVKDLVRDYGMVLVDECHHIPAFSFEQILRKVAGRYVYGLTATPVRQDGHHPIIFMQCGPVRYRVDARKQAEERPFDHFIIPRFTPFRKPVSQDEGDWHITEIYRELSRHDLRNELIVNDVVGSVAERRNPLVLTERTAHVETLAKALRETLPNVISLTGSMSAKERKGALAALAEIPAEQNFVLVATGKFVGEGFDEPRLDTLFLAMPVAWKGTVQQYAGRLHRLCETKNDVLIYDYVDIHVGVLERMYHKRLKGYASIGYTAKSDSKSFESQNVIFDNTNFLTVFHNDLAAAKNEIVIVSPYLGKNRVKQMLSVLTPVMYNGVKVTVVTRPETDYKEKDRLSVRELAGSLENAGIHIVFRSGIHQKFAIMDQRIVWYGSINLLSFGRSEESMMRLDSLRIANELRCSLET